MTTIYKYHVKITGARPASANTIYRDSAYNAADRGLAYRAEPGATATITNIETGKVLRECGTNERGGVYEV